MKKNLLTAKHLFLIRRLVILTVLFSFPLILKAQDILTDNFEYNVGNIVGQGDWKQQASTTTTPVQVVDTVLTYPGYQDKGVGKAVKIENSGQDIYKEFAERTVGTVYYAALVCINKAQSNTIGDYFLHFGEGGGNVAFCARLFAKTSENGKLQFAVTRTNVATSKEFATMEYEFGKTHLVIVKYTLKGNGSSAKDDEVSLFIDPVISETEPAPLIVGTNTSTANPDKIAGIYIRQGATGKTALGYVDALRVSSTWSGLFGSVVNPDPVPALEISPKSVIFGEVYGGETYEKVINVKGKDLKGDITVGRMTTGELKASATVITKIEAEAENGYDLTLTLEPADVEIYKDNVIFSSEGMADVKISPAWNTTIFTDIPDLKTLRAKEADRSTLYKVTGETVISHIYVDGSKTYYYLQDAEKGITVMDAFGDITTEYKEGDKLTGICGTLELSFGSLFMLPARDFGIPVSSGNEITQVSVTLTELSATPKEYESRLIRTNAEFVGVSGAQVPPVFTEGANPEITDGSTTSRMRIFKGADYVGTTIPVKAVITGISTSGAGNLVAPRRLGDITQLVEESNNLFLNPGFEEWTGSAMFGYNPGEWESTMGTTFQEREIKQSGEYALRIKTAKLDAKLEQEVSPETPLVFLPGEKYELTLRYYTVTSNNGNDISLKSYWRAGGTTELTHDKEILNNGTFFTSVGKWETKTIQTTVPQGASSFYFALSVPKGGSEVIFDDFSFKKVISDEPSLVVIPGKIAKMTTNINVPVTSEKIMIFSENLPAAVSLEVTGKNASFFTPSVTVIPVNKHITELTIAYNPDAVGEHTAMLIIDCPGAEALSSTISLKGYAIDPDKKPIITIDQTGPLAFTSKVGEKEKKTVLVSSKNLPDYLYARVMGESRGQFIISNTLLAGNVDNVELNITFSPKAEGSFTERVAVYCKTDTVFISLQGLATPGSGQEVEGDRFPLDVSNPHSLLNEHFDAITHNKVLKLDEWKNIAVKNTRAWWGYNFKDDADKVIESVAKVTAFNSVSTEELPHEMWLVTPALDFKNTANKVFTFRVMGDLMLEDQDALLEVCYMDMEDGELYTNPVDIKMPSIPDENHEWREYHINLEGQPIADVFFIGFHFKGTGGKVNSAVYYIDDVSYGRTDLPSVTPSVTSLEMVARAGETIVSDPINVQAKNLASPITLTVGGPNASKFKLSAEKLPITGGTFTISFESAEIGVHQAYVKIASRGAADIYIPVSVRNENPQNIANVVFNEDTEVVVFDYTGKELLRKTIRGSVEQLTDKLKNGMYILRTDKGNYKLRVNNH